MAIICFEKKLIFIKTTKTAGTSVEIDLSQCLAATAVVTPIFPTVVGHVARNYEILGRERGFYNHMSATEIRELIGPRDFDRFTKFCVEREPVTKCISHFHMLHNSPDHKNEFARNWNVYCEAGRFPIDVGKYYDRAQGGLLVDHVLRYDRLATDLPALLSALGIEGFGLKTRAKSEYSRNIVVTPEQVTPMERTNIYASFARTLAVTGLRWDT